MINLSLDGQVGAWVQVCCPRLSIDWGGDYSTPLLNPYECMVACKQVTVEPSFYFFFSLFLPVGGFFAVVHFAVKKKKMCFS